MVDLPDWTPETAIAEVPQMATTHTVSWKKADDADDDNLVVWIDVAKLDETWRLGPSDAYLSPKGGHRETFRYIREAVAGNAILRMPRVYFVEPRFPKQQIRFLDGRHRFAFVRDHGGTAMPVTVAREDLPRARFLFGSEARTCEVRI